MSCIFKSSISLFLALILSLTSRMVYADFFEPNHSCSKPYKPYQFNSQYEIDRFNEEVQRYKQCISDFVEKQNDAIRNHSNAADDAINDWNNFVNHELN